MNSDYSEGTSIVNGLKMGVLTVLFGSVFAIPITSFFLISTFFMPPITAFNIAIIVFTCTHGVFFNIIPYTLAGFVTIIFKLSKKSIVWVGIIAMGVATGIGIHYGNLIDISEIKTFPDILLALALCIALFFPYFFVFTLLNLFRKK
jgi:hypothetical protein